MTVGYRSRNPITIHSITRVNALNLCFGMITHSSHVDCHLAFCVSELGEERLELDTVAEQNDFSLLSVFYFVRYIKLLIQEAAFKMDMGFLSAFMETIAIDTSSDGDFYSKLANFSNDMDLASSQLLTDAEIQSYYELRNIFDYVHISPLKVSNSPMFFCIHI